MGVIGVHCICDRSDLTDRTDLTDQYQLSFSRLEKGIDLSYTTPIVSRILLGIAEVRLNYGELK